MPRWAAAPPPPLPVVCWETFHISDLPPDCLSSIFARLGVDERLRLRLVCRAWSSAALDPQVRIWIGFGRR